MIIKTTQASVRLSKTKLKNILAFLFLLLALLLPHVGNSQTACTTVSWSSGWCTICGGSSYACNPPWSGSGNWNNGIRNFTNPIPAGNTMTSVCVTVRKADCGYGTLCVFINGFLIQCKPPIGDCWCGNCWPQTYCFTGVVPGYNYGGTNSLQITISGGGGYQAVCVTDANICFTYAPSCIQSVAPSSASASPNPTCGGATTLSVGGGSLGTGASWKWYSGGCGGSLVGTGATISVSPSSTTTYFVRAVGNCNTTGCVQVTVTVQTPSTAPSSVNASQYTICGGGSATLSVSGGSLGTGASWYWYAGGCGSGGAIGTGTSITVSPGSTTTYYVRAQGTCNTTACAQVTITSGSNSTAPSSATASPGSLCGSGSSTLTENGGTLGLGASYMWYSGACGGSLIGTGTSIWVSPSSTTTYYVLASGTCNTTACAPVTVTVNTAPVATASPSTQSICSGGITSVALTSSVGGTSFSWTVAPSGVSGATNSSGTSISQTLSTTGPVTGTVVYTVTPFAGGCSGNPITVTIVVNPIPSATAIPSTQIICSGGVTSISLTSNVTPTSFNWTVTQSGATGAAPGSGSTIAQTIVATGTSAGTVTYTVTPSTVTCTGPPLTIIVTVNPKPIATAVPATQTICSGETTSIALNSNISGTVFNWTASFTGVTGAPSGSGSSITQSLVATGTTTGTATYTVTPSVGSCGGIPILVTISVNPKPVVTATPASQTLCTGSSTAITLTSNISGTTFSWTVAQTGVSGATPGSGASIAQPLSATGTVAGTAVYTITPTVSGSNCSGTPINVTITVNPIPVVTSVPTSQTICSGTATAINLSSNVGSTSFAWTISQTAVTGGAAGTGSSITQTLTNTGSTAGSAVYTITPTASGCVGIPISVIVNVDRTPLATATPTVQTICSGEATSIVLTSDIPGSTFAWTIAQTGVSGATPGGGSSITQILSATGTTAGTVTYTITPTSGICPGPAITVTITVNPKPVATATPASQAICSGDTTSILLSSNIGSTSYSWTVTQTGVAGATPGSGASIAQILTLTGSTSGSVVYTITPSSSNGCIGTAITVVVTVNKADNSSFNYSASTYCQTEPNPTPAITGLAGGTFTATPAGLVFVNINSGKINLTASTIGTYAITYTTNGPCPTTTTVNVTIITFPIATFSYSPPPFCQYSSNISPVFASGASAGIFTAPVGVVLVNPATGVIDLSLSTPGTYTVTNTIAPGACPGAIDSFLITINTAPIVTATPAVQSICSGSATSIALTSSIGGSTFVWTVVETGVSGATPGSGSSIAQTLSTTGNVTGTAVYTIIPTTPDGCPGQAITVTITVNPVMVATATPMADTICSGSTTSIALSSTVVGTLFTWTVVQTGVSGATPGSGLNIAQTITSTGTVTGTAVYTIIPSANNCNGAPVIVTITVNPVPVLTTTPSTQTICSGDATSIALTSDVTGTTFAWTFNQTNASGASDGNGTTIIQTLSATGNTAGIVTYTVTPTANGCSGTPVIVTVNVNPRPVVTASPPTDAFCSFGATSIALTSNVTGTTYAWTVVQSNVTGGSPGNGSSIVQTLSTTGTTAGTAIYTITPTANGCAGTPFYDTVRVSPIPVATATPVSQTFCSGGTTSIALSSTVIGTTFSWTVVQTGVSGATTGSDSTIAETLTATGILPGTAAYTITPTAGGGCQGSPISVTITVKPRAIVTPIPSAVTICSGDSTFIFLISNIPGTTFVWTVNQIGATGGFPSSGSTITQGLTTTGTTAGTVIYTITPSYGSCPGTPVSDTVTVFPRPVATATPTSQNICSGDTTAIALSSNVLGTTFPWTVVQTDVNGATAGGWDTISQMLTNTSTFNLPGTAVYTVTPLANGCSGTPLNITITVNPSDDDGYSYTSGTYCQTAPNPTPTITGLPGGTFSSSPAGLSLNSTTGTIINSTSGLGTYTLCYTTNGPCPKSNCINMTITIAPNAVFSYAGSPYCQFGSTNPFPVFGVGASAGVFTASPAGLQFVQVNTGEIDLLTSLPGTYVVTNTIPAGGTCAAEIASFTITISPGPTATASPSQQTICSGDSTSFVLTSTMSGTIYSWTVTQTGVSGGSDGSGTSVNQVLATTSTASGTAVYIITPSAGGCTGLPITVTVFVNSIPFATAIPSAQIICSGDSPLIVLTSNIPGTTFSWTVAETNATGASPSTGSFISQAITATTTSTGTVLYTITPTSGGCSGSPISVTITVNPEAIATATPTVQTICSGDSTSILLSSNIVGTTFTWTVAQSGATGASAGNGDTISQILAATFGSTPGTVTYTITPSANACPGAPILVTITVNPNPVATVSPAAQTICSGNATSLALTSNISGTTFSWTVVQTGVSGATSGNGQNIVQNITATDSLGGTAIYTITPTSNGCSGIPKNVAVTVNPTPVVTATPSSQTICSGNITGISLSSNVPGTTFSWTVSQNNCTGATAGSGTSIAQTLTATTSGTALYIITPLGGSCPGLPISVTITVKPTLVAIALPSTKTICSGDSVLILLTSNIPGTTFTWIVNQNNVVGATNGSGDSIAQMLTATGSTSGTATYTVTPVAGGCSGLPIIVTITVNPPPVVTPLPSSQILCSGATTSISLTSSVPGTTFSWTVSQTGVTGATAGSGALITQTLTTTGAVDGTAIYTITPSANGCIGTPVNVTVTVTLLDDASFEYTSATYCISGSDPTPTITGLPGGTFLSTTPPDSLTVSPTTGLIDLSTSAMGTYTLSYTTNGPCPNTSSINVTIKDSTTTTSANFSYLGSPFCQYGTNPAPIYGAGASAGYYTASSSSLVFVSVNTGEIDLMLSAPGSYTITNTIPVSGTCAGAVATYSIIISDSPEATATPSAQTICSGSSTSIVLSSTMPGTTYAWTVVQTGVSGASAGANDSIIQTLSTTGLVSGSVVYTIIPTAGSCPGTPITVTVIVDPCPIGTAIPSAQVICSGEATSISLASNIIGTTFSWTVTQSGTTGASDGSGENIVQTLTATGTSAGTAIYTVNMTADSCAGVPLTITVTVNPVPVVTASPTTQTICTGDTAIIILTSTVTGTTYSWVVSQLGVTGGADGSGDTISQILSATGTIPGVITYTITPTAPGDCPGQPITVSVTVNPDAIVTATPTAQILCSGGTTAVVLNSNINGSTFSWTVVQTGVSGATPDTGTFITQTLTATDSIPGTAVYTATATDTATGCPGTPVNVYITVNAIPVITATPPAQTICTGSTTAISLSSNVFGTSFSWTVVQSGITGAVAGSGTSIAQTLAVADTTTGTAVYTISSIGGGCTGNTITVTITVNAMDSTAFSYSSPSFCQTGIDPTAIIAGLPGGTFTSSPGLVLLDTLTGLIDLSASTIGLHTVKYTTSGLCSDTSNTYVSITPAPGVGFTYTDSSYCQNGNNPFPILDSLAIAGVFSATPAGLVFVDSLTGQIDLSASDTGTYTITNYLAASGGCGSDTAKRVITIIPLIATATPSSQAICSGSATSIVLSSSLPGTTYSWTVVGTGIIGDTAGTDSVIVQTLTLTGSVPGSAVYSIFPSTSACVGDTITVTITVNPALIGTATPTSQTICSGGSTSIVLTSNTSGSIFSWIVNQAGVSGATAGSDSVISQILTATGTTAGTAIYTIVPSANGCSGSPMTVTVTVTPAEDASFTYPSATYCQSGTNPTPSITGLSGGIFSASPIGLVIDSLTGTINLSGSTLGAYNLCYSIPGSCPISSCITLTIGNTNPSAGFSYVGSPFCQNGSNPFPTFSSGASAGIFSSSPSGLVFVQVNTGEIDLAASNPGTYTITNTIPASGSCLAASATSTVTINVSDDASFVYTSATYCQSGTDPVPTITGLPGGTFSSIPTGLLIDSITGTINLDSSILGVYTLSYATNGPCPNTSSITMVITDTTPSTNFSYPGSPFCLNGNNPFPTFGLGASAGIFSVSPSGLVFVHVNTGQIDLLSSTPGTYTVTNTIPVSGSCLASTSTSIVVINSSDDASFVYSSSTYCQSGTNPTPSITGVSGGIFSATPAGLVIDSLTGTITLSSSALGAYTLCYSTNSACPNSECITMTISDTTPVVNFSYPASPFCQNGNNPSPTYGSGSSAGIFSATPVGLSFVNLNTGEINLSLSLPGTYIVTDSIPASGTCLAASGTTTIIITSSDDASFTYSSSTYCQSGTDPSATIVGLPGGTFSAVPTGLVINSTTGEIDLSLSNLGTYLLSYTTTGTCSNTSSISMTITDTTPSSTFNYSSFTYCQNGSNPLPIFATGASAGIFSASPTGLVFVHVNTGEIDLIGSTPGTYTVTNTIPVSGTCLASFSITTITISSSPVITATPSSQSICTGGTTSIVLTSSIPGATYNWTVTQAGVTGATADSGAIIAQTLSTSSSNQGVATYTITSDANGCIGDPITVPITIIPSPLADIFGVVVTPSNCFDTAGSIAGIVIPPGQNQLTYIWQNTAGDTVGTSANLGNVIPGTYTLTIRDANGCSTILGPFTVTATSGVIAAFTANPLTGQTPLTINFTNNSIDATNYLWQFGTIDTSTEVNPTYIIEPSGQFQICLTAYNAFSCMDSVCTTIEVDQNSVFIIPNIFTPNDDNVNDVFTVQGIGLKTMNAEIFNRWGEKMSEWHTTNGGWDGRTASGLPASTGTYYYIINAEGKDGKKYFEKGAFSLIRENNK